MTDHLETEVKLPVVVLTEAEKKEGDDIRGGIPTIEAIITDLSPYQKEIAEYEEQLPRVEIKSIEDYRNGEEFLKALKRGHDNTKKLRDDLFGNASSFIRWGQARFKKVLDRFDQVRAGVEAKMLAWLKAEEERQAAEQKRIRDEQEARALEAAEKAGDPGLAEEIMQAAIEAPAPRTGVRGHGTSTPKRWIATPHNTIEICKAIVAGNLPTDIIGEFSQQNMNAFAKKTQKEGTFFGLKIEHSASMRVRS